MIRKLHGHSLLLIKTRVADIKTNHHTIILSSFEAHLMMLRRNLGNQHKVKTRMITSSI